jgi:prepilin-type processing-associated H-X9-DG protein
MVVSAIHRPADAKSILDNPDFQTVMQKLRAPATYNSFSYVDLPRTMPLSYQTWLEASRLYLGIGDLFGSQSPPLVMPPLDKIMAETEPAGAVSWSDDAGLHLRAIEPFPGADVLASGNNMSVGEVPLLMSIMLPSLNRARETANRVKSASNLRQIGMGIMQYSAEHQGAYPPDLGTLVKTQDIPIVAFVSPDSNTAAPPNLTPDQGADWVNNNSDYIYIGAGLKQGAAPENVVCYEKEAIHHGDGMNILYGDGHVEWQGVAEGRQQIEQSKKAAAGGL